jgi:hypothetical protein
MGKSITPRFLVVARIVVFREPQQTTRLLSSQAAILDTIDVSVFLLYRHRLNVRYLVVTMSHTNHF